MQLCSSDSTALHQKVLLYIELQAVVQVVIQLLAEHLDPAQPQKLGEVQQKLYDESRETHGPSFSRFSFYEEEKECEGYILYTSYVSWWI